MNSCEAVIEKCLAQSQSRFDFWSQFLQYHQIQQVAEIGVYKGDFAAMLLKQCPSIEHYYMIDPWRHLDDWNKPANKSNVEFEQLLLETQVKTEFASAKREILRGKTTEVIDDIAEASLDFAYIDGDHSLKGITIDLIRVYTKIRVGGWIGGDDFTKTIWQHRSTFEPTLVLSFCSLLC